MRKVGLWFAAAFAAFAATPVLGQPALNRWAAHPTGEAMRAALSGTWPEGARVALRCKARPDGSLSDCAVVAERPAGRGLGRALLGLVPGYRLKPEDIPPEGEVTLIENRLSSDTPPDWRRKPTPAQLYAAWPAEAWSRGAEGQAEINCLVATSGTLFDCFVLSESPPGAQFGAAAIALTPQFLMWPAKLRGQPVVSAVTIPIGFRWPPGQRPATPIPTGWMRLLIRPSVSWAEAPTLAEVAAAYPAKARAARSSGFVSIQCGFHRDGRLDGCDVAAEEPKGQGFGAAAKGLLRRFRLDPALAGDQPVNRARVNLPISFNAEAIDRGDPGRPVLTLRPDPVEVRAALQRLRPSGGAGRVTLSCPVAQGGALQTCRVAEEEPGGLRLGEAALSLQDRIRVSTWTDEGLPVVGGTVLIPVKFDAPPAVR
ncbi:MAG: hypothetical protein JWQ97_496 [Phenylobacterium sp.]|nr:hypothetical protein [Phenylobacterium sp.]